MMHRYVIAIPTTPDSRAYAAVSDALGDKLHGWESALDTPLAKAWVFNRRPSCLRWRKYMSSGCIIGTDFTNDYCNEISENSNGTNYDDLFRRSWGAYVAVNVDLSERRVSVLRDPTGRIDCWRLRLPGTDLLFSHFGDVADFSPGSIQINWDYIAYHLSNGWLQGAETGFSSVDEVLPGQEINYTQGHSIATMRWQPHEIANEPYATVDEASQALRRAAETSVLHWARKYHSIALDLSGGLDSSIVLGLLRAHAGHNNVVGLNYITPHPESDERNFAREAADFHRVDLIELEMSSDYIGPEIPFSGRLLRPAGRQIASLYDDTCSRAYEGLGADAYFSGTGGDHLFYDHLTVSALCDYRRDNGLSFGMLRTAHRLSQLSRSTAWSALGMAVADCFAGAPTLRSVVYRDNPFSTDATREAIDIERFTHPWLQDGLLQIAPAKMRQILSIMELQRHYNRYGRADVSEEVHPLFSQPLMEASLRTPAYWFGAGGIQRGLARNAFADLLPRSIKERRTKSANSSLWLEVLARDFSTHRERLLDGNLVRKGLLDRRKLEDALNNITIIGARQVDANLIDCLTTEMWVQKSHDYLTYQCRSPEHA